jgi:hypothetical protein
MHEIATFCRLSDSQENRLSYAHAHGSSVQHFSIHNSLSAWQQRGPFGNSALELHATRKDGDTKRVARVVFWDAYGYGVFYFETYHTQVPVLVAEQLVALAKAPINIL